MTSLEVQATAAASKVGRDWDRALHQEEEFKPLLAR